MPLIMIIPACIEHVLPVKKFLDVDSQCFLDYQNFDYPNSNVDNIF